MKVTKVTKNVSKIVRLIDSIKRLPEELEKAKNIKVKITKPKPPSK